MLWLSLFTSTFVVVQSTQQCRSTYSVWGRYLKDHVMSSENVKNIGMCYIQCSMNHRCRSINFHFGNLLCELNNADRYTHPWDYVLINDHAYSVVMFAFFVHFSSKVILAVSLFCSCFVYFYVFLIIFISKIFLNSL